MHTLFVIYIAFAFCICCNYATPGETLNAAIAATDATLDEISNRWMIEHYPAFLHSVAMPHSSWATMRVRFELKILKGLLTVANNTFVASFTGSSVTAGHDTDFKDTFTELLGRRMESPLAKVNIKMVSRNAALGNNPCLPYDLCVTPFAGLDADVVHWEQSFNCNCDNKHQSLFEHFIRESINLPNKPVVIFADSYQPNWGEDKCKEKKPIVITENEKKSLQLLNTTPVEIVADMNKNILNEKFRGLTPFVEKYKSAGIQLWSHGNYDHYKCHGPYIPTWGCCSASWHPSKEGHILRADHTAFFWLLIFREALQKISTALQADKDLPLLLHDAKAHIHGEAKYAPIQPLVASRYPDNLRCFTSFQPRAEESRSLEALVIPSGDGKPGFSSIIMEDINHKDIVSKAKARGYKDFKHVLYGNKDSGALSLKINVTIEGIGFLCQPPGNWGKYPAGFQNFWDPEINTEVYLTTHVVDTTGFVFKVDAAERLTYTQKETKDSQSWLCVDFDKPLPQGSHVMSIVPTTDVKVMFAYLLIP